MPDSPTLTGRVIKSHGSRYIVLTAEGSFDCALRGKFRQSQKKEVNPVAVGDRVTITIEEAPYGSIEVIEERTNKLSRPDVMRPEWEQVLVANCDQLVVVTAVMQPKFKYGAIDRFLLIAEKSGLDAAVVLNKVDLAAPESYARAIEVYRLAGYATVATSAVDGHGIEDLRKLVQLKTSIFAGHSGVGKSSLLNALEPGLGIRTRSVSTSTDRGTHTTTYVELHPLTFGGFIADMPGVRAIGLWDVQPENLPTLYREFRPYHGTCRFHNCLHIGEPNCAVRAAVDEGKIAPERYDGYMRIRGSLQEE